ncbi:alpha/beta fold hydrolase [Rathayibacter sp. VKM Ac-2630]|uniref:alpha/beta fold hydrolase n=1 Tax=Rathayibacter sp. VKM Ac-2630 TaxID=1938617 RepID=UPI000981B0BA
MTTRTALLLHGLGGAGGTWWRVAEALEAAGWTVSAPDLRGHGDGARGGSSRHDDFADDVLALRPDGGGAWGLVVGHSLGGAVAVRAAARDPEWAARLALIDPVLRLPEESARRCAPTSSTRSPRRTSSSPPRCPAGTPATAPRSCGRRTRPTPPPSPRYSTTTTRGTCWPTCPPCGPRCWCSRATRRSSRSSARGWRPRCCGRIRGCGTRSWRERGTARTATGRPRPWRCCGSGRRARRRPETGSPEERPPRRSRRVSQR